MEKNVNFSIKSSDKNMVDCFVQFGELSFFLTCVYGEPASDGKSVVWERLSRLGVSRSAPWSIVGDFNEILNNDEKLGGPRRSESSFKPFKDMRNCCNMDELNSKGDMFTWSGKRWKKWIQCRLDRCFGNKEWGLLFPGANQTFLDKRGSDHRPVWVNLIANPEPRRGQSRFDKRLLHHPDAIKEVEREWKKSASSVPVAFKIRKCRGVMGAWKRKQRFNARDKITLLQERLEWFQSKPYSCWFVINNLKKSSCRHIRRRRCFGGRRAEKNG